MELTTNGIIKNIKLFETYKNKLFNEDLLKLAMPLYKNIELEPITNLLLLMNDYKSCITN